MFWDHILKPLKSGLTVQLTYVLTWNALDVLASALFLYMAGSIMVKGVVFFISGVLLTKRLFLQIQKADDTKPAI